MWVDDIWTSLRQYWTCKLRQCWSMGTERTSIRRETDLDLKHILSSSTNLPKDIHPTKTPIQISANV